MIDFSQVAPKMVSADEAKREESAKLTSERRPTVQYAALGVPTETRPKFYPSLATAGVTTIYSLLRENGWL